MATLNTPYAILAFPALFQPRPKFGDAADLVYEATLIFPPSSQTSPAYKAMQDAVIGQAKEGFGEQVKMNTLMLPFHDAGEKAGTWNGFEPGMTYVKTWSKRQTRRRGRPSRGYPSSRRSLGRSDGARQRHARNGGTTTTSAA